MMSLPKLRMCDLNLNLLTKIYEYISVHSSSLITISNAFSVNRNNLIIFEGSHLETTVKNTSIHGNKTSSCKCSQLWSLQPTETKQ